MPTCKICRKDLPAEGFCPSLLKKTKPVCRKCYKELRKTYRRSINGTIGNLYRYQKNKTRVDYTLKELCDWLFNHSKFYSYYRCWVEGGYDRMFIPCVVRLDFSKHFSLDNIEVVTRKNVFAKNKKDTIRRVVQMDMDGNELATFPNSHVAGKMLSLNYMNIYSICTKARGRVSCGGFRWRFA